MAINFPLSLDSLSNPSSGDKLDNPSHSTQHGDANDILEALETKLGIGASPAGSATAGFPLVHSSGGTTAWAQVGYEGITSGTASSGQVLTAGTAIGTAIWSTPTTSKVIQIVNATYGTQTNSTTTANADTGLTVSITPTSASNKCLIFVHQNGIRTSTNNNVGQFFLNRGATNIVMFEVSAAETGSNITMEVAGAGTTYLDSPATTSATTYKTVFNRRAGTGTLSCQYDGAVSSITVMEVTP
jgi:hypothetical protein